MIKESDMQNVGVKSKDDCCQPVTGKSKERIDYPSLYLSSKELPDIEKAIVGDIVTIHAYAKVISKSENESLSGYDKGKRCNVTLEIQRMALKEGKNPAKSQAQHKLMGADLARKRTGEKTKTGMSESKLKDYAGTKEKGLPKRKLAQTRLKKGGKYNG